MGGAYAGGDVFRDPSLSGAARVYAWLGRPGRDRTWPTGQASSIQADRGWKATEECPCMQC
jgi:hypothetical protein